MKLFSSDKNPIEGIKARIQKIAESFVQLTKDIGHKDLIETAEDVLTHISDPYLFVIVGEVKAGKSSFINALLQSGKEICKVAPSPMTDTIQQVTYGEEESETSGQHDRRRRPSLHAFPRFAVFGRCFQSPCTSLLFR